MRSTIRALRADKPRGSARPEVSPAVPRSRDRVTRLRHRAAKKRLAIRRRRRCHRHTSTVRPLVERLGAMG